MVFYGTRNSRLGAAFGAVGTIEVNPDADLLNQMVIAVVGLAVMLTGVSAMKESV